MRKQAVDQHQEKNLVDLRDENSQVRIIGEITFLENFLEIHAAAIGLNIENRSGYRPKKLTGTSSTLGRIWIDRIFAVSYSVSDDGSRTAIAHIKALNAYWGSFDPTESEFNCVDVSMECVPVLADEPLVDGEISECRKHFTTTWNFQVNPVEIYCNNLLQIQILHQSALHVLENVVKHKQRMSIKFKSTPDLQDALHILDQTSTLLSLVLDYQIATREVKLIGNGDTTAWLPNTKEDHDALDPSKWLVDPEEILPFFRKHIGSWLDSTKSPADLTLIKSVMHSRRPGSTIEGEFLCCCQSFEELSRRRIGRDKFDPSEFAQARDSVLEFVDKMEAKGEIKRKIKNAIKNSNSLTLSDRIRGTFKEKPYWKHEAKSKYKDIEDRIEKKRNELSHGNPTGFVQSQSDADLFFILCDYIFLHFLGETLILAGVDESQIGDLVSRSASCSHLLHALKRVKPA